MNRNISFHQSSIVRLDVDLFQIMEYPAVRRWFQIPEPVPHRGQPRAERGIDHGDLIGDDLLEFIVMPFAFLPIQLLGTQGKKLIDPLLPGRGRRGLLRVPHVQLARR